MTTTNNTNHFEDYTLEDIFTKTPIQTISTDIFEGDLEEVDITFEYATEEGMDSFVDFQPGTTLCLEDQLKAYIIENKYDLFEHHIYDKHNMVEDISAVITYHKGKVLLEADIKQQVTITPIQL